MPSLHLKTVLIESDWNLKHYKGYVRFAHTSINRIRLEFKVGCGIVTEAYFGVLIESDWNLKFLSLPPVTAAKSGINRIRLEFKDDRKYIPISYFLVLIESDWNLKLKRLCLPYG